MIAQKAPETSILFSLAELADIEQQRIREEEEQHARSRAEREHERRLAMERRCEQEAARVAAEGEARLQREREQAHARARVVARQQAAVEVARIEADGRAKLQADNAKRAHELELLRVRDERRGRRLQRGLALGLGVLLCGASAVAYGLTRQLTGLEQETARLRTAELSRQHTQESTLQAELAALDRRRDGLARRPATAAAEQAGAAASAARATLEGGRLDHGALAAYGEALDAWRARQELLIELAQLDRRRADLLAWASTLRRGELGAAPSRAAARAHATDADEATLAAYEQALDELRNELAAANRASGARGTSQTGRDVPPHSCDASSGDPWCDINGKPLLGR